MTDAISFGKLLNDFVAPHEVPCPRGAETGTELCAEHKRQIFGFLYESPRVSKSTGISLLWVVEYAGSCRGQGFRRHHRALAEADYQARRMRWRAAERRAECHSCDDCQAEREARRERHARAFACLNNLAARWLTRHTEPTPPEDPS